jgi:uncharacterized membrane protein YeiH
VTWLLWALLLVEIGVAHMAAVGVIVSRERRLGWMGVLVLISFGAGMTASSINERIL